ncbi:MAG: hypothetical protein R3E42_16855 [Burkholderiaceae bacterium]
MNATAKKIAKKTTAAPVQAKARAAQPARKVVSSGPVSKHRSTQASRQEGRCEAGGNQARC